MAAPLCLYAVSAALFYGFIADDSFITARYAENLVDWGQLVFNPGERISALTSPFHALFMAGIYFLTGIRPLVVYRALMVVMVPVVLVVAACQLFKEQRRRAVFLLLTLGSPFTVLWTVGGLETPMLLIVVTIILILMNRPVEYLSHATAFVLFATVALAFCIRYDSIVFTIWPCLYLAIRRSNGVRTAVLAILAASMPFGWLVFSYGFYGDVFPTSFYLKGTSGSVKQTALNAIYVIYFLIMSGLAVAASSWPLRRLRYLTRGLSKDWWLVFGTASFTLYALHASAVHMMFGYRLFVPFLPVFAFIVAVAGSPPLRIGRVAMLVVIQILVTGHMFTYAVNATPASLMRSVGLRNQLSRLGFENSGLSVREYEWASIRVWTAIADDAARDWESRPIISPSRRPRMSTFVGGLVPYRFRGADAYDSLLAYRHRCTRDIRDSVDYVVAAFDADRSGADRRDALLGHVTQWRLITRYETRIDDGRLVLYELYVNREEPMPFPLPARVGGECLS